jgi:outer membrane autotransporter protein
LELGENSAINIGYATSFDTNGVSSFEGGKLTMSSGNLVLSNSTARINVSGSSSKSSGSVQISTGGVDAGTNALIDVVNANFGWLTVVTNVSDSGGILASFGYNSLTNSSLSDLDHDLLGLVDDFLTDTNEVSEKEFLSLNTTSSSDGAESFRYAISQAPDASESAFQINQQVNGQLAARGTEFRSANGFASSKPNFGKQNQPIGVAGPDGEEEKSLQGWIRAYGSFGNKDKTDKFTDYDSSSWGSVIGVDKSFGNLLIGVAGGFARTDLDAGSAYDADIDTYHGSIYSTIGGESIYVDLAATYGIAKTEAESVTVSDDFDSNFMSFYIGAGKRFDVKEKISITPEASFLLSYYEQEEYTRTGLLGGGEMEEYDTTSYISSLGANIATLHHVDWLNRGLAFIPELRLHWLHEFEADPDDFKYTLDKTYSFAVRPRDEDTLRLGVGFDVWNWRYQSTKFEVDYDGLYSDTYSEHIFSGKISVKF